MNESEAYTLLREGNTQDVKEWLHGSLRAWFVEGQSKSGFAPFSEWIGIADTITEDIARIFYAVPAKRQARWRRAVADLVSETPAEASNVPIFEVLFGLARSVPAFEVLPRITDRVRTDVGDLLGADIEPLQTMILETAIELAVDTAEARECLETLVAHGAVEKDVSFARVALCALCRANPRGWVKYLNLLGRDIQRLILEYDLRPEDVASLVTEILSIIGPTRLERHAHAITAWWWFCMGLGKHVQFSGAAPQILLIVSPSRRYPISVPNSVVSPHQHLIMPTVTSDSNVGGFGDSLRSKARAFAPA